MAFRAGTSTINIRLLVCRLALRNGLEGRPQKLTTPHDPGGLALDPQPERAGLNRAEFPLNHSWHSILQPINPWRP